MLTFPKCPACGGDQWQRQLYSRYGREQNLWSSGNSEFLGVLTTEPEEFIERMESGAWVCQHCWRAPDAKTLAAVEEIFKQAEQILPF
jgi:hypothetical protein